ncbi:MAG TPA: histidine kinase [Solirubrobacteraceae bacterium]|jgi:two-component system LytT family sensor kinase|nr:histidine kinase [Solirubrobacteraceae bacterium]
MDLALGVVLGIGIAAALAAVWRAVHGSGTRGIPEDAMRAALHAATATLPHLRRGLNSRTAERAVPYLRALTGAAAIALADTRAVLAIDGEGREQVRPGDLLSRLLERTGDDRLHIVPRLVSSDPTCPLRSAVLAPLVAQDKRIGTLIAFYRSVGRPSHHELRVVQEAASLVSAQVELSLVAAQEERLAQAELRALRAQISPHFIYNALAAVAGDIHARPEEARDLLIDFAEFTRYLFRDGRSYVTLGEEIEHVERYLRLEQARFRDILHVTIDVPDATRGTVVPAMSVQPLVENAVRHGVEKRAGRGRVTISAEVVGGDVELRVSDDGIGIERERLGAVLAGAGGGIGVSNVDSRLRATFGERYALRIESEVGHGTTAVMTVPNLRGEIADPELVSSA